MNKINKKAFTLIELLVVIAIIGILSSLIVVSMGGATGFANDAKKKSDIDALKKALLLYNIDKGGVYPIETCIIGSTCVTLPTALVSYLINLPNGPNNEHYSYFSDGKTYTISIPISNGQNFLYHSILGSSTVTWMCGDSIVDVRDGTTYTTVLIGAQCWMKKNMNIGTNIAGGVAQTNNSSIEKWCYNNDLNNCNIYGGLYQWDEAMQYSTVEGVQGICPANFHFPTDTEWKTLEMYLGMSQAEADAISWRGTHAESTQLKSGGTSGFEGLLSGGYYNAIWNVNGTYGFWATSSQLNASYAWQRQVASGNSLIVRTSTGNYSLKTAGIPVRCLKN